VARGAGADVAVLRYEDAPARYTDCGRARLDSRVALASVLSLRAGGSAWIPASVFSRRYEDVPDRCWRVPERQG
jgi:hypothetical protein